MRVAILGGVYLLLIFAIISIEVTFGPSSALGWAYLVLTLVYALGAVIVCFADIKEKHIAFICAVAAILLGLPAGLVIGVIFKFLIGGHI